jgi:hypothetical protein
MTPSGLDQDWQCFQIRKELLCFITSDEPAVQLLPNRIGDLQKSEVEDNGTPPDWAMSLKTC